MAKKWICYYELFENDKYIGKGTSEEVAKMIGCTRSTVNSYAIYNKLIYGKYKVVKVDTKLVEIEYQRNYKPKTEFNDNTLDYLVRHLKEYGNTVMPNKVKPDKYLEPLREMGLDCLVRSVPEFMDNKQVGWYHILEVK